MKRYLVFVAVALLVLAAPAVAADKSYYATRYDVAATRAAVRRELGKARQNRKATRRSKAGRPEYLFSEQASKRRLLIHSVAR